MKKAEDIKISMIDNYPHLEKCFPTLEEIFHIVCDKEDVIKEKREEEFRPVLNEMMHPSSLRAPPNNVAANLDVDSSSDSECQNECIKDEDKEDDNDKSSEEILKSVPIISNSDVEKLENNSVRCDEEDTEKNISDEPSSSKMKRKLGDSPKNELPCKRQLNEKNEIPAINRKLFGNKRHINPSQVVPKSFMSKKYQVDRVVALQSVVKAGPSVIAIIPNAERFVLYQIFISYSF